MYTSLAPVIYKQTLPMYQSLEINLSCSPLQHSVFFYLNIALHPNNNKKRAHSNLTDKSNTFVQKRCFKNRNHKHIKFCSLHQHPSNWIIH